MRLRTINDDIDNFEKQNKQKQTKKDMCIIFNVKSATSLRLSNEKIYDAITSVDPALEALLQSGWELEDDDTLVLPPGVEVDFPNHVHKILEAKQHLKKKEEEDRRQKGIYYLHLIIID